MNADSANCVRCGIDSGGIDRASGIAHGEYGGRCEFVVGGTGFGKGCKSV